MTTSSETAVEAMPGMVSLGFSDRATSGPWEVTLRGKHISGPYYTYADAERALSRWKREYGSHVKIEEVRS